MKHKLKTLGILCMMIILVVSGCSNDEKGQMEDNSVSTDATNKLNVFASFYPYYDFASKIGGDNIDITTIVPSGTEPHSFEPSPKVIAALEKADVFIYNGVDMEPWLDKVLVLLEGKDITLVDASKSVELAVYEENDGSGNHNHDHDHEEEDHGHDHGIYDPHIWVDPMNAVKIAEAIKDAFSARNMENHQVYEDAYIKFKGELEALDTAFKNAFENIEDKKIIVSHSAFGYLARRYNIEEISIAGITPNAEPSPKRLAELTKIAKEHKIRYVFFEALASVKTAEALAMEADLEVLTLYNLEGLTEEQANNGDDYISIMYKNLETLKKALVE